MFVNYGDFNFFEFGILVDMEHSETEFSILYCRPFDDEEDQYLFADCLVSIEDNWINRNDVMSYLGMDAEDFDAVQFAIGCVMFYGVENFSNPYEGYVFTKEEVKEKLRSYQISKNNLKVVW